MTIVINSSTTQGRRDLPAQRDRGRSDIPLRTNPFETTSPDEEALIGLYPYSGADIKLVVHLPPEDPRATNQRLTEAQEELRRLQQILDMTSTETEITQMESSIISLRQQLEEAHNALSATPEDDPGFTTLQSDIEDLNEQIAELTSILQRTARGNDRVQLQQEMEALTNAIETMQDESIGVTARTKTLAEVQTLSLSVHREKYPVRTLGSVYIRSVTRGPRTISGSMVFTTFHSHIMQEFLEATQYRSTGVGDWDRFRWTSYLMDQIPPLDVSISFANEYGNLSWMTILGVEFINEGQVMSIEDLFIEGTCQYIARDFDPIRNVANRPLIRNQGVGQTLNGTSIMMEDLRRRVAHRNIPWI